MQCFRCGGDIPGFDYTCPACGAELSLGEQLCRQCWTPILCARCRGAASDASSGPSSPGSPLESDLQYEYTTMQVRVRARGEDESRESYRQYIQQRLTQETLPAALEGWQTVEPLDYDLLKRRGLVNYDWWILLGREAVTVRLKRLTRR